MKHGSCQVQFLGCVGGELLVMGVYRITFSLAWNWLVKVALTLTEALWLIKLQFENRGFDLSIQGNSTYANLFIPKGEFRLAYEGWSHLHFSYVFPVNSNFTVGAKKSFLIKTYWYCHLSRSFQKTCQQLFHDQVQIKDSIVSAN